MDAKGICVFLSGEMTYPPVKQLHSQANLLAVKFEQGEGGNYIDDAINLDREALELCQPGHPTVTCPLATCK